ncbi:MAG: hypothetical protein XXXJIFNMEKO3_03130 [Candidatus Erwinia impunctatus]|nr:hypothetical protein XXXJIFNMEKO_03130 [Culicoides impunctatus]
MRAIAARSGHLLVGWGSVGVIYTLCDHLQGPGYQLPPLWIDTLIPYSPSAIWLYLSFFLIVPLGYFLVPMVRIRWLTMAIQLSALVAGAVYLLWPTTMHYPPLEGEGHAVKVAGWLIAIDSSQNCFPSLHAALTMLAVWAIALCRCGWLTLVSVAWALAIGFSILQLCRHLFIDLAGGMLVAWSCGWLVMRWLIPPAIPGRPDE